MKILIDTNILIHLEDNKIIQKEFSRFYNLAITNDCRILYHPNAIPKDIERDKDDERKTIMLSKIEKYTRLDNFATPTLDYLAKLKNKKVNDQIDNRQLFQLYKGYVDWFITQDKGIHSKSETLGIKESVLNISQALSLLEKRFTIKMPSHPILRQQSIREIEKFFNTDFFDSLRADYLKDDFNLWLEKCIKNNRYCYSLVVDGYLQALLIYNVEKVEDHQIPNIFEKALKICTLKVSNDAFGIKLGELFLNKMFEYCINNSIKHLYLTVYEKQNELIKLLAKFGFKRQNFNNKQGINEIRMIKCLDKEKIKINSNVIEIHPFYHDHENISKFVVPIRPGYYSTLFKDGRLREPSLFDIELDSINEIQGNTILKAYISKTRITSLKQGDLLFFYSSKTSKSIEPIGILEFAQWVDNFDDLWCIVQKKTVYSQEQLNDMLVKNGKLHIIIFRLIAYMEKKIGLQKIKQIDSFRNKLQTVTKLKETDYIKLKDEYYFDKRYIID